MELRFKSASKSSSLQNEAIAEKSCTETQFASTLRKNVNAYFKEKGISPKGNLNLVSQTVVMLSLYIIPFVLLLILPMTWWIGLLLTVAMGIGIAGIGMCVMHDALHGSYSKKEWLNKLLGGTIYLLGAMFLTGKCSTMFFIIPSPISKGKMKILNQGDIYAYRKMRPSGNSTVINIFMRSFSMD